MVRIVYTQYRVWSENVPLWMRSPPSFIRARSPLPLEVQDQADEMEAYTVSWAVNNPANQGADLMQARSV